jgi:hypothetical protein
VQYLPRSRGAVSSYAVRGKLRPVSLREQQASGGAYQAGDVILIVPQELVPAEWPPLPGDAWQDAAGNYYRVLNVQGSKFSGGAYQTWRVTGRNLALAYGLSERITIEQAGVTYDAAGTPQRLWPSGPGPQGGRILVQDLLCRIQPEDAVPTEGRGLRGQEVRYTIFLQRELPELDVRLARVWWPARGLYLDILRYAQAERLEELPLLEAVWRQE